MYKSKYSLQLLPTLVIFPEMTALTITIRVKQESSAIIASAIIANANVLQVCSFLVKLSTFFQSC